MATDKLSKLDRPGVPEVIPPLLEILLSSREAARPSPRSDLALKDYWRSLRRRKWTIVLFAAAVFVLVGAASLLMTPLYEGVGRISVGRENSNMLGLKEGQTDVSGDNAEYSMYLDAQLQILSSATVVLQASQELGWLPGQGQPGPNEAQGARLDNEQETLRVRDIQRHLDVSRVPRTPVIEIRYSSPNPRLAAAFVNGVMQAYVEQNFKAKYDSAVQISNWLTDQLQDLKAKVESSQEKLVQYQKQKGILGIDEKQNIVTEKLDELNKELTAAEADRVQKQAIYESDSSKDAELLPATADNPVIQHLKQQLSEIEGQYAQATTQLGPAHPKVLELRNQLNQVNSALADEINKISGRSRTAYLIALKQEQMLRAALEGQKRLANQLNESAVQYNILQHDLQSNQQLYDGLLQKLKEAGVSAGLRSNNVRVVDYARVPIRPSLPNIPLNLAGGLLLGCLGGGILALVLEKCDDRVRTPTDVEILTALPLVAMIPDFVSRANGQRPLELFAGSTNGGGERVELVTYAKPMSEIAESYRALRNSLLLSTATTPPKIIVVTSALPNEGKTTTSINCAIVLAQKGARVLLIDADFKAPRVHLALGIPATVGLTTLLTELAPPYPMDLIIQTAHLPNLSVLPAGPSPDQPAELLGSECMKRLLIQWRGQFDHIVIDTAPILSATDSVALCVEADSVLLTVRSGKTPKDALLRARDLLLNVGAKVTGVVVNAVDLHEPGLGYYGYPYDQYKDRKEPKHG